jgi:prophage antirepressor-like protein
LNSLSIFEFESNQIRVAVINGEPWFVAKDIANILEHSNSTVLVASLKDREKGVSQVSTPGGNQEMTVVSESGLYRILMRSDKPKAEGFQDWIAEKVIPSVRKTGGYTLSIKDPIELIIESAQHLLEVKRRVEESEKAIAEIKQEVSAINQRAIAAEQELKALPAPSKSSQSRTARANINSLVRAFCHKNNIQHAEAFKNLYREFRDRYHIDLKIRAANGKSAPLDIAESLDVAEDLYALADEMFGGVNA